MNPAPFETNKNEFIKSELSLLHSFRTERQTNK